MVVCASSAELAREMLTDFAPDLFVLDIDLPGQDGWSLAQHLRDGALAGIPIIMISGHAKDAEMPMLQLALYDTFIFKPYNLDDLILQIAELLKLELQIADDTSTEPIGASHLSASDAAELIELAKSGRASAIRDRLSQLEEVEACPRAVAGDTEKPVCDFRSEGHSPAT